MKKVLSIVLVIAVIACVGAGFAGCDKIFAPKLEKEIVGTWITESGLAITFREDGTVSGTFDFIGSLSIDGKYTVDSENSKVTISYSILGISYNKECDASIEEDVLSLTTEALLGTDTITTKYTRQAEEQ